MTVFLASVGLLLVVKEYVDHVCSLSGWLISMWSDLPWLLAQLWMCFARRPSMNVLPQYGHFSMTTFSKSSCATLLRWWIFILDTFVGNVGNRFRSFFGNFSCCAKYSFSHWGMWIWMLWIVYFLPHMWQITSLGGSPTLRFPWSMNIQDGEPTTWTPRDSVAFGDDEFSFLNPLQPIVLDFLFDGLRLAFAWTSVFSPKVVLALALLFVCDVTYCSGWILEMRLGRGRVVTSRFHSELLVE